MKRIKPNEEQIAQITKMLSRGVDPIHIVKNMKVGFERVQIIAKQHGIYCRSRFIDRAIKKPSKEGKVWVNLQARNDGSGYF